MFFAGSDLAPLAPGSAPPRTPSMTSGGSESVRRRRLRVNLAARLPQARARRRRPRRRRRRHLLQRGRREIQIFLHGRRPAVGCRSGVRGRGRHRVAVSPEVVLWRVRGAARHGLLLRVLLRRVRRLTAEGVRLRLPEVAERRRRLRAVAVWGRGAHRTGAPLLLVEGRAGGGLATLLLRYCGLRVIRGLRLDALRLRPGQVSPGALAKLLPLRGLLAPPPGLPSSATLAARAALPRTA